MKTVNFGMVALVALVLMAMGRAEAPADVEYLDGQKVFIKTRIGFQKKTDNGCLTADWKRRRND